MHTLRYLMEHNVGTKTRSLTSLAEKTSQELFHKISATKMGAWQMEKYGGLDEVQFNSNSPLPVIRNTDDVLIEVHAASVNPLDILMLNGYGRTVLGTLRNLNNLQGRNMIEFPLTVGRDFAGIVRDKGSGVSQLQIGDEVMGVVLAPRNGSHAHYTVTPSNLIVKKPKNLTFDESSSLGYAGLTAWSALTTFGGFGPRKSKGKRALIIGGSGGVGTIAIQFLKAWGATVGCVSNGNAFDLVTSLGADIVIDYTLPQWRMQLREMEKFDLVLNCVGDSGSGIETDTLKTWNNAKFVTLTTPLLRNIEGFGWAVGLLQSAAEFGFDNAQKLLNGQRHYWAYVLPCNEGLKEILKLAESEKLIPVIESVYSFKEVKGAYTKVKVGHARGKTVINVKN